MDAQSQQMHLNTIPVCKPSITAKVGMERFLKARVTGSFL